MTSATAQTNLQLYQQLSLGGWTTDELARARAAYDLTVQLSAGQMRGSGKPALSHLVGTAGIVAAHTERRTPVLAALMHAAYPLGDFGAGRRGSSRRNRAVVRAAVGDEAEQIVYRYGDLGWPSARIEDFCARADALDQLDRDVAVIRLANAVEDHADLGMRYRGVSAEQIRADRSIDLMVELAGRIGVPALGTALTEAVERELSAEIPAALVLQRTQYVVTPRSYRVRAAVRLRALASGARRRVRATGGSGRRSG